MSEGSDSEVVDSEVLAAKEGSFMTARRGQKGTGHGKDGGS